MPRLTARSFGEMIHLPAYEQQRILAEQKYPRQGPSVFKIPYYKPALDLIRDFYTDGNNKALVRQWITQTAPIINLESRRLNNIRVASAITVGTQSQRQIQINRTAVKFAAIIQNSIDLRLTFDLHGIENGTALYVLYNLRSAAIDPEIAKDTIQICYWILQQNGQKAAIGQLEYVDLVNGSVYKARQLTNKLLTKMQNNAQIITAIWNTI